MEALIQQAVAQPTEPPKQSIHQLMNTILDGEKLRGRFDELLGRRAPQFISSIVALINAAPQLQQAFYEAPMTVVQAALKAAVFDLPIDNNLGYAYIVPFNNKTPEGGKRMEAAFILGWKGMHQLALRSGVYRTINVMDVREGELQSFDRLKEEISLQFIPDDETRETLPVVGYVGYYRLINGMEKTIYLTKAQIEAHERRFRKGTYQGRGWREDWDAMARKTVYRQLIGKWGVMSIDYLTQDAALSLAGQLAEDAGAVIEAEKVPVEAMTRAGGSPD